MRRTWALQADFMAIINVDTFRFLLSPRMVLKLLEQSAALPLGITGRTKWSLKSLSHITALLRHITALFWATYFSSRRGCPRVLKLCMGFSHVRQNSVAERRVKRAQT